MKYLVKGNISERWASPFEVEIEADDEDHAEDLVRDALETLGVSAEGFEWGESEFIEDDPSDSYITSVEEL